MPEMKHAVCSQYVKHKAGDICVRCGGLESAHTLDDLPVAIGLTLQDRAAEYARQFPHWPASHLRVVREQDRDVLYGLWMLGNDYRNKAGYYGEYPPGYLSRVQALFPDVIDRQNADDVLHCFSGSMADGPYTRLDINPKCAPDLVGSVYDLPELVAKAFVFGESHRFKLVFADPPYSEKDAAKYGTLMIDRRGALNAIAMVTVAGGYLVWLDTCWPMFSKRQWATVGRICLVRSTNHRVRLVSIFQRVAS